MSAPIAKKVPVIHTICDNKLLDDYAWMREKDAPEVLDYLKAENAFTETTMAFAKPLQAKLYEEMLARIKQTDLSVPVKNRGFYYYSRTEEGKEYPLYCRKKGTLEAPEEVMLDVNALRVGRAFVGIADTHVTDDTNVLGYLRDETGFREYDLHFKHLAGGESPTETMKCVSSFEFASDNKTVLYVTDDEAKRAYRLWRHTLGTDPKTDVLVYEEKDERFTIGVSRTRDRQILLVTVDSHTTSEVHWIPANDPTYEMRTVAAREDDHEYAVDHRDGTFYILTNDRGRNFRLVTASCDNTTRDSWKELVAHRDDVMLEDVDVFRDHYVLSSRENVSEELTVVDFATNTARTIEVDEPLHSMGLGGNPDFESTTLRFSYTSYVTPLSVYDFDTKSHTKTLLKRQEVLGTYNPADYASERTTANAKDGTGIPVTLVYKKGIVRDGKAPLLLYGYGAYGVPLSAEFDSSRLSLLDRGVIFAQAHVRGGGDLGKTWHDLGRMETKMSSFTDFIACAEHLVKEKYTSPERLAARGGSAGGLLMGAVINMRPDLFKAIVAEVPFVDVINTMLDESLPLTVGEFEEWGNPKEKPAFDTMVAYSPYDNVRAQHYPAMMIISAYNDSQVMYWEPAKWIAKLRATKTDQNPLLLKMELDPAGHGGKSGRYERLHERAFMFSFLFWQLGVAEV